MSNKKALISMGSNMTDGDKRLRNALAWLSTLLSDMTDSGIFTSEALTGDGTYFNVVVCGLTTLSAEEFETLAKRKEAASGRVRPSNQVTLDIDLVRLDNEIVRATELDRCYFVEGLHRLTDKLQHAQSC